MPRSKKPKTSQGPMVSNSLTINSIIENIAEAGRTRKTITLTYINAKSETSVRDTEPYEIKDGKYFGYCLDKNEIRGFSLSNIVSATITQNSYNPRWAIKF